MSTEEILIRTNGPLLTMSQVAQLLPSFALMGIFVGPVVLAAAWTLLKAWIVDADRPVNDYRD